MMVAIVLLFVLSGFFRGFDMKMIESFTMTVPNWLELIHNRSAQITEAIMEENKGFWYADWSFPICWPALSGVSPDAYVLSARYRRI